MVATTKTKSPTKSPRKQKYPQAVTGEDKPKVYCKQIELKTDSQKAYVAAINDSDIVICKGPAGTGKTFIAIYAAVNMLVNGKVDKIILTRPVVEAGEKLGFLPGDLNEKIDPFMIPLWDSLEYFLGPTKLKSMKEEGFIEVSPLAYQRGRTFRNCLTADAMVLLADGQYIPIVDLVERYEKGENFSVKSYDFDTDSVINVEISAAFGEQSLGDLIKFTLSDGTQLSVTQDHKFWCSDSRDLTLAPGYVEARNIEKYHNFFLLYRDENAPDLDVPLFNLLKPTNIEKINSDKVYDITVPGTHNFFTTNGVLSHNCAVVLDECQNASQEQVKMCLTRIGPGSKIILSGDTRQSDLINDGRENALEWAHRKLTSVHDKIQTIEFSNADIVRHYLISIILNSLESKT